jgi:hypothetical protein
MSQKRSLVLKSYSRIDTCSDKTLELRSFELPPKEYSRRLRQIKEVSPIALKYLGFLSEYGEGLFRPEKCDVYEPIKEIFDPEDLAEPASWLSQPWGRVMIKKRRPFCYEGFIENKRHPAIWVGDSKVPKPRPPDPVFLTELCLWLDVKVLKVLGADAIIQFFIDFYLQIGGEYGYLAADEDHHLKNYRAVPIDIGISHRFEGDNLEKCLPGIFWVNIFGGAYVDWFGKQKLAKTPCFRHHELPDGSHYIQVAENVMYYKDPDGVEQDNRILQHLGPDVFYDIKDPDKICRVPDFRKPGDDAEFRK